MKKLKRFFSTRTTRASSSQRHSTLAASRSTEPTTTIEVCDGVGACRLENVPFDIRHQILLALDSIEDLNALVCASPIYYRQHLLRRKFWLWRCLWVALDRNIADAYSVHISNSRQFRRKRNLKRTQNFITEYEMRCSISTEELFDLPTTEDITGMLNFHMNIILPLLHEYVAWARGNLPALCTPPSVSQSERRRIIRALYRFQLFCNIFGKLPHTLGPDIPRRVRPDLFRTFEPWEIEEVACINMFADRKYEEVFTKVQKDLDPDHPKFDSVRNVVTPPGSYRLENDMFREYYRNGMVSLGLPHLLTTIKIKDHSKLVDLTAENMTNGDDWIRDVISHRAQERRREHKYSDRDKAQDRRDELLFVGDEAAMAPLAWVTIWRGTYSNLYGEHLPDSLRTWGYVMWDADRLTQTGGFAALNEQWGEMWILPDGVELDPRDEM